MISLSSFKNAFLGIIPSTVMTCNKECTPNIAYLSQVHLLSDTQIALTTQFFNKTKSNLAENPYCAVRVYDPDSFLCYELSAKHKSTETSGPTFDQMAKRLAAIADYSGASHAFTLQAIEIMDVLSVEVVQCESFPMAVDSSESTVKTSRLNFESMQKVCERIGQAQNLEDLFDSTLQAIDLEFGLRHSMILITQSDSDRLLTISTRGYNQAGVGAEVVLGEGVIGRAAEAKVPLAHASLTRDLLYARASFKNSECQEPATQLHEAIPLPGLIKSQSQIAIPLVLRGELLGVLFAESSKIFEIRDSDEHILKTLGHVLAIAMHSLQMSHELEVDNSPRRGKSTLPSQRAQEKSIFSYFPKEDCILLNGEYLVRSVPARILWKILNIYKSQGKTEFTNRELRLDPWLQLPEVKDNLETRLILLRKRLDKKCSAVTITSTGRGRFLLSVVGDIILNEN